MVAAMAALLLGLAGYNFYLRNANASLLVEMAANAALIESQHQELKAGAARELRGAATLKQYLADNRSLAKKESIANDKLNSALKDSKEWASTPIPDAVADWLRDNQALDGDSPGTAP